MLERQSRVIHLQFLKDVKLQQMTDSQQEMLLYHLKDLSFLEVRTTDTIKGTRMGRTLKFIQNGREIL